MKKTPKRKTYTAEFKENAVKRALENGNRSLVARQLNISYTILTSWIALAKKANATGTSLSQSITEKERISELEKKNRALEEELEIIKKATAYFAKEHLPKNTPGSY